MDTLQELLEAGEQSTALRYQLKEAEERAERLKAAGFETAGNKLGEEIERARKLNEVTKRGLLKFGVKQIRAFLLKKTGQAHLGRGDADIMPLIKKYRAAFTLLKPYRFDPLFDEGWANSTNYEVCPPSSCWASHKVLESRPWEDAYGIKRQTPTKIMVIAWVEMPIGLYPEVPPDEVLERAESFKGVFDYLTVGKVETMECEPVKDPLLLGRLNGSEDRFFLAQWGDDLHVEDIL